jgi:hypothetical protein
MDLNPEDLQSDLGTTEASKPDAADNQEIALSSDHPLPVKKRYAHLGKRRRSYTEELFRCQFTDMISRTPLICNHLLWRNKPLELRDHLKEHMKVEEVDALTDDEISKRYSDAKRIFLEGIPEDEEGDEDGTEEDQDSDAE